MTLYRRRSEMESTSHPAYFNRLLAIHGMMGFIQYAVAFSVPLLRRDLHITRVEASLHNMGWALAVVTVSFTLPKFTQRFSPRHLLQVGWLLSLIGILCFCLGQTLFVTVPAFTLAAVGATIFNNTNAAILGSHSPTALKMMLRTTGIGGLLGALSPTVIGVFAHNGVSWSVTVGVSTILIGVVAILIIPIIPSRSEGTKYQLRIRWDADFISLVCFGFITIWLECGSVSWALDLLVDRGQELKTAVIFVTAVGYFIAISRILFSFFPNIRTRTLWNYSAIFMGGSLICIILTHSYTVTLIALICTGFGVGPLGGISLGKSARSEQGPDVGVASFALGMGPALGIAPWVTGGVSERWGFSAAYTLILVFLVIATVLFYRLEKKR
jgi:fucose permease